MQETTHKQSTSMTNRTCSPGSCMVSYSSSSFAEQQKPVRELRRPGGGKPHGEVRSMVLEASGQVCHNLCTPQCSDCLACIDPSQSSHI